jgi:O-antigen ligase
VEVWLGTNHIYFSIVMAFAILGGIWMLLQRGPVIFRGGRIVVIVLVVLCFLEMHVLTTRTGLVGLYLTGLILGWIELLKRRRFLLALVLAVGLASMPFIGYHTVDPFKHRIDNTIMDVGEYLQGKDPNYLSIGTRIESWKTAFHLWKKHPLIGVANADLEADMTDQYVEDKTALCPENFVQPHNQFLQYLAGMGLLGFVLLCLAWFYPVFSKAWNKDLLFWMFWLNYTFAMLGESTMERQIGVGFLVVGFMLTLGINRPLPYTPPYESGESLG